VVSASGPAGPSALRRHNLGLVLTALREGPFSRAELASRTGLTRATVASLVEPLVARRVLAEELAPPRGVGRPARPLRFHPDGPVALGIAVDVDRTVVVALDLGGAMVGRREIVADHRAHTPDELVATAADLASTLVAEVGRPVLGAGLALPALLAADPAGALVLRAPNLPRLTGTRPGPALAAALGVPVVVDNEATLAAAAHLGLAGDFVHLSAGIGLGGGIVLDGRVFRGARGLAGELGHVVVEREGPACGCGGRGCVEQYAGRGALLAGSGAADVEALVEAVAAGEARATAAVARAGAALGAAVTSVLHVLDVSTVVLGGDYARLAPALLPALAAELEARLMQPAALRVSTLGPDAPARGAAGTVLDRALREPDALMITETPESPSPVTTLPQFR
jgi:predicted NBD/HSP70 family sugar kinase